MTNNKDYTHIFKQIAAQQQITAAEVYREMELAILSGFENNSPDVQAQWAKVPRRGDLPTPEELIEYIFTKNLI